MKKAFTLLLFLISQFSFAQNLVPNPSFVTCPDALGQVTRAVDWYPCRLSPDYYNTCAGASGTDASVPRNYFGYQYPSSGNAYMGFYAKAGQSSVREYIGVQLTTPLQEGTKYYVSLKVNLANFGHPGYFAVNKLGVLFSSIHYTFSNPAPICNCAHIYTDTIITDTLNWTRITGAFIADFNYSFINIGNFFTDSATQSIGPGSSSSGYAYYYLDDICVSTDSTFAYNYTYLGLNKLELIKPVKLYPNPFVDFITFENIMDAETFILYDIYGHLLKNQKLNNAQYYTWDLSDLASGSYILEVGRKDFIKTNYIIVKL